MESTVKILVKNVYVPSETAPFDVSGSLCVKELKQQIASVFPGNPAPSAQKLIFGGKICTDDETLNALLTQNQANHGDEAVVFHLLVTTHVPKSRPTTPVAAVNTSLPPVTTAEAATSPISQPEHTPAPAPSITAPASVAAARSFVDSPRPMAASSNPLNMPSVTLPSREAPAPPASATFPPPLANHHELYAQHMLLQQQVAIMAQIQYLQQLKLHTEANRASSNATPTAAGPPGGAQHVPMAAHFGHHFGHAPHFAPYMGMGFHPAHGLHAPGAAAAGAGVGAQPTEPAVPAAPRRDGLFMQLMRETLPLLDIRLAMKMAFMLFIIGQDTPLERILLLSFLSFVSYLHITGILIKIYEVLTRNRRPTPAPGAADGNNDDAQANGQIDPNRVNAAFGDAASRFNQLARIVRISNDRGFVQDVKSFFVGLLLSLVPAWQPQPLDANVAPAVNPGDVPIQGI